MTESSLFLLHVNLAKCDTSKQRKLKIDNYVKLS
jgi:hypothetical protein